MLRYVMTGALAALAACAAMLGGIQLWLSRGDPTPTPEAIKPLAATPTGNDTSLTLSPSPQRETSPLPSVSMTADSGNNPVALPSPPSPNSKNTAPVKLAPPAQSGAAISTTPPPSVVL